MRQRRRLIRHRGNLRAVRQNAQVMYDLRGERKSIGHYMAEWPTDRIVDLWHHLKKTLQSTGWKPGAVFPAHVGQGYLFADGFCEPGAVEMGAVQSIPRAKRALQNIQEIFNQWSDESQRPLCQISMILALSVD